MKQGCYVDDLVANQALKEDTDQTNQAVLKVLVLETHHQDQQQWQCT